MYGNHIFFSHSFVIRHLWYSFSNQGLSPITALSYLNVNQHKTQRDEVKTCLLTPSSWDSLRICQEPEHVCPGMAKLGRGWSISYGELKEAVLSLEQSILGRQEL